MKIKAYGTRGSIPIARPDCVRHGGNTTCLRVMSDCLPKDTALVVDAGSGYFQCSTDILRSGILKLAILFTHWHWDHTIGVTMAPHTFVPTTKVQVFGPKEHGRGPDEILCTLMRSPEFPVDFEMVRHRFQLKDLENVGKQVLLIHPEGGFHLIPLHTFEKYDEEKSQVPMGKAGRFPVNECLVIKMFKAKHPEYTISYRFEERPTGKVFVFLTDHENTDAMPWDLVVHLNGANLLIQDSQYSREWYEKRAGGFGHGTPDYCARAACLAGVDVLALTHHDPNANDDEVDKRVAEARESVNTRTHGEGKVPTVLSLADYMELEV